MFIVIWPCDIEFNGGSSPEKNYILDDVSISKCEPHITETYSMWGALDSQGWISRYFEARCPVNGEKYESSQTLFSGGLTVLRRFLIRAIVEPG